MLVTFMKRLIFQACIVFVASAMVLPWSYSAQADGPLSPDGKVLLARYPAIKPKLEKNQFGIPIYLESKEARSSLHVDLYGIFEYPFVDIKKALQSPGNWCDINLLLINTKACTFREVLDQSLLTLYSGRKFYQPPRDAYVLDFVFRIAALQQEYLDITLTAKNGPLFTKDHRIRVEALQLDKGRTFIHFSYGYSYGILARAAMKTYYETIGRDKKGFSIVATDKKGEPVFLGGVRGSEERNAVRYYFAIQAYMEALVIPVNQRFEEQIIRWFDLTDRFPKQLYEMDKEAYLANKRLEHKNQLMLQKEADQ